jgi:hypothetical protein
MALPCQIDTNGEWGDVEQRLYDCFCGVFKRTPPLQVRGKKLVCDSRIIDSNREEGFWHVVTRGRADDRLFDPARARCLPWIEPMLTENLDGLSRWADVHGSGATRLHFWMEAERYVVILQERENVASLVTAFFVEDWGARDLRKSRGRGSLF